MSANKIDKVEGKAAAQTPRPEHINLRVVNNLSTTHSELQFHLKTTTRLRRLKDIYCSRLGIDIDTVRFVFDGQRVKDDDTAVSLGLVDRDIIEICPQANGGM